LRVRVRVRSYPQKPSTCTSVSAVSAPKQCISIPSVPSLAVT
jgi:hypothetical protein